MKTILVPTDFSAAARNASLYALQLAQATQSRILLFHVYHIPVPPTDELIMANIKNADEYQEENASRIREEISFLKEHSEVLVEGKAVEGLAVDEISELEKREKPYLIIMGMQAAGAMSEFLFGSVTTDLIRKTETPVIIVPEQYHFDKLKKVVFADDHSDDVEIPFVFRDILELYGAKVFILHVNKLNEKVEVGSQPSGTKIEHYFSNTEHVYDFLETDDLVHGITEFIDHYKIDMVAMMPHKHNLLQRLFKESQTQKMAFHTKVPLFVSPIQTEELS